MLRLLLPVSLLLITLCASAERIEASLSPDEAVKKGIRLGITPLDKRYGETRYMVGLDARELLSGMNFHGFRIIIQKQRQPEPELTARMWHIEWPEKVLYTSFEIEETFLYNLYVLIDYGSENDGITYRVPVLPYLNRKSQELPDALRVFNEEEENVYTSSTEAQAGEVTIVATRDTRVIVRQEKNKERLFSGSLAEGESITLQREGVIRVVSPEIENLSVEINGQAFTSDQTGLRQVWYSMDGPVPPPQ